MKLSSLSALAASGRWRYRSKIESARCVSRGNGRRARQESGRFLCRCLTVLRLRRQTKFRDRRDQPVLDVEEQVVQRLQNACGLLMPCQTSARLRARSGVLVWLRGPVSPSHSEAGAVDVEQFLIVRRFRRDGRWRSGESARCRPTGER